MTPQKFVTGFNSGSELKSNQTLIILGYKIVNLGKEKESGNFIF